MKRLLCAASIFALLVPAAALAQHQSDKHQGDNQHADKNGHQAQGHQGRGNSAQHQGRTAAAARPVAQTAQGQRSGRSYSGNRSSVQSVQRQGAER